MLRRLGSVPDRTEKTRDEKIVACCSNNFTCSHRHGLQVGGTVKRGGDVLRLACSASVKIGTASAKDGTLRACLLVAAGKNLVLWRRLPVPHYRNVTRVFITGRRRGVRRATATTNLCITSVILPRLLTAHPTAAVPATKATHTEQNLLTAMATNVRARAVLRNVAFASWRRSHQPRSGNIVQTIIHHNALRRGVVNRVRARRERDRHTADRVDNGKARAVQRGVRGVERARRREHHGAHAHDEHGGRLHGAACRALCGWDARLRGRTRCHPRVHEEAPTHANFA